MKSEERGTAGESKGTAGENREMVRERSESIRKDGSEGREVRGNRVAEVREGCGGQREHTSAQEEVKSGYLVIESNTDDK